MTGNSDEWMTLGCLEVKVQHREGSYSFATGPRATLQVSMQGTYWIDGGAFSMSLARTVKGKTTISAHRSRSKMSSARQISVSRRPPKGSHALRSSALERRMTKFFTTASPNTVSPSSSNKDRDVTFWHEADQAVGLIRSAVEGQTDMDHSLFEVSL